MTPDKADEVANPVIISDFLKKIVNDVSDILSRNEDIFFGKTLPDGYGHFLAITSLAGIINCILEANISIGSLTPEGARKVAKSAYTQILGDI